MNKTAKNSIIYLFGTVIMGVLGFVNTMLLTRVLSQQVYAMCGLLTTFVTAADMFVAFGYDQSYMRFYYSHDRSPVGFLLECMKVPLIIFGVFAVVLLAPGQHLITYVFEDKLGMYVIFGILAQVFFSSIGRFSQLTARMGEFALNYVFANTMARSGSIVLIVLLSRLVEDVTFDLVVMSNVIVAIASLGINLWVFRKLGSSKNLAGKPVMNRELLQYGFPYMINNVIVLVIPVLEKVIIRDLAGWEILSIFTAASVFQTVVSMVSLTLTNIWNPIVYKHCENEKVFKPILHTFGMAGTMILTMGTAACILLRRWLVLLLDEKYFEVYIISPVILLSSCFQILTIIYSVGINIKKKTIHLIVAPLLQAGLSIVFCHLLVPSMGLIGVAVAVLVSVGIRHLYRITVGFRYYGTDVSEIKPFLLCVLSVVAAVCALFYTELTSDILLSGLLILVGFGIINKDILLIFKSLVTVVKPEKKKES